MIPKLRQIDPEPPWTVFTGIGLVVAMFAILVVGSTLADMVMPDSSAALLAGWGMGMALMALAILALYRRHPDEAEALRIGVMPTNGFLIFGLSLAMAFTLDLVGWIVVGDKTLATMELLNFNAGVTFYGWLTALVFMGLLQPVAEELVFRGVLFPALRFTLGAWTGLLMSAAFYAAFHLVAYLPESADRTIFVWYGLALPFVAGLVAGCVRAYTGNTRAAMMAHAAFGLFAVFKVWALTGGIN